MSIQCHTKANGVAKPASLGCKFTSNPVQFDVNQKSQSCFSPNLIGRPSRKTLAPIHWHLIPIYCQFIVNQGQTHHQSDANPESIHCQSYVNQELAILVQFHCQSYVNPVTFLCKFFANPLPNVVLLIYCNTISIKCQHGVKSKSSIRVGVNKGGQLASFDALCARCFTFYTDVAGFLKYPQNIE